MKAGYVCVHPGGLYEVHIFYISQLVVYIYTPPAERLGGLTSLAQLQNTLFKGHSLLLTVCY